MAKKRTPKKLTLLRKNLLEKRVKETKRPIPRVPNPTGDRIPGGKGRKYPSGVRRPSKEKGEEIRELKLKMKRRTDRNPQTKTIREEHLVEVLQKWGECKKVELLEKRSQEEIGCKGVKIE